MGAPSNTEDFILDYDALSRDTVKTSVIKIRVLRMSFAFSDFSSPSRQLDGVLVEHGVFCPVEPPLEPLVLLPPGDFHLLPLLPSLGQPLPFQHPDDLRHRRAVLRRRLRAEQSHLDHHLHLLPVVAPLQVPVNDRVQPLLPLQLLHLR